ncbi:MAG: hypothetical protein ACRYFX_14005 [Janthinobacterium lividum]
MAGIVGIRQSKPSFEVLQRILTGYPSVSPNWLLFGRGQMLVPQQPAPTHEPPHQVTAGGNATVAGLSVSPEALQHEQQREAEYQQAAAHHERVVAVFHALGEYLAKTGDSPELRAFLGMMNEALTPPLSPAQEDNLHEQQVEDRQRQEEALSDEEHEQRLADYRAQGNH